MARERRISPRVVGLIALTVVTVALFATLVPINIELYKNPPGFVFLVGVLLCGSPLLSIVRPRTAIIVFCVAACALPLPVLTRPTPWPWPWSVPALLTLVALIAVLGLVHNWRFALVAWLSSVAASLLIVVVLPGAVPAANAIANLVIVTSVSGGALLITVLVASRLRVGAELTREREQSALEQSRRVIVEERTRIARELHDVVAHSMSLIQVQAATARYRVPGLAPEAASEFEDIAATARGSLTEMRRILGVLRTEDQSIELAPQQGLSDLDELVDSMRRAGADVSLSLPAFPPDDVPAAVGIAVYRITQEALSNAMRHSPRSPVEVDVAYDGDALHLRVHNSRGPAAAATDSHPRGHGLRGMRERAELLGGSLEAGPDPVGGWTVLAHLPLGAGPSKENP